jgi:hypothetical protein
LEYPNQKVSQNEFRLLVVKGLISLYGPITVQDTESPNPGDRTEAMHIPQCVSNEARKKCALCKVKCAYYCPRCDIWLCITSKKNCFELYHFDNRFNLTWKPLKRREQGYNTI